MSVVRMATFILVMLAHALVAHAQATWDANQVNTTMCYWEQLRAAVVRDTVYLDGGYIGWLPGLSDGGYGAITVDNNPLGTVYTLNFSVPFEITQNITAILGTLSKAGDGNPASNLAPNYYDGAMLGNDNEWFLYGGLLKDTAAFTPPYPDDVLSYQAYQYGLQKGGFHPGFVHVRLPPNMTRYLAYGGAANAPSENKAWYFSGMHSPSWGEVYAPTLNESLTAIDVSNTLITLDMAVQQKETWNNVTLPPEIHGRANPELVWVPVGSQGILVALGGVTHPEFVSNAHQSKNERASVKESPAFMSTIDIYDVASGEWYQQSTRDGPGQLTRGCAVVATAQDLSSFNLYYYGGYDGLHRKEDFNDDIWVLSLPSFTWTKVAEGTAGHGRAGHKCVTPYPDQMMVIGGSAPLTGGSPICVKGGIINIFNLTSAKWMTSYDPAKWGEYGVPEAVFQKIGGSETGGATLTTPSPSGWASSKLSKVFETPYPATKIAEYYPYVSATPTNTTNPDFEPAASSGSGVPSYLPPVLGSIFGVMFVALIGLAFLLWRRRRLLRLRGTSETYTEDSKGNRIISWIRGQPIEAKAPPTVVTDETPMSPEMETPSIAVSAPVPIAHHEMADTHIAELMDTSPRPELQDTGLTPFEIINKHTHFATAGTGGDGTTPSNPSAYNSISATDRSSTVSRPSAAPHDPSPSLRPDSPPLGAGEAGNPGDHQEPGPRQTVQSGVSELSERDRAHLRQMSDATVSSAATAARDAEAVSSAGAAPAPAAATGEADGGARTVPLRKSIFFENEEDLGGGRS